MTVRKGKIFRNKRQFAKESKMRNKPTKPFPCWSKLFGADVHKHIHYSLSDEAV